MKKINLSKGLDTVKQRFNSIRDKIDPIFYNIFVITVTIILYLVMFSMASYCFSSTSDVLVLSGFGVLAISIYMLYKVIQHLIRKER